MPDSGIKNMGQKGRKRVIAEFSKEKMAERIENEFDVIPRQADSSSKAIFLFVCGAAAAVVVGLVLTTLQYRFL